MMWFLGGHILFGVLAVVGLLALAFQLFKNVPIVGLVRFLAFGSFFAVLLAWLDGGIYYVNYYGQIVKPVILAGDFTWIHKILMESKEHLFLFLPFLAAVLALAVWMFGDQFDKFPHLRRALATVSLTAAFLGLVVMLMGMAVSGSVG